MLKKYLILALILILGAGSLFAQRYSDDPSTRSIRNWDRGFGNDPFQISDDFGLDNVAGAPESSDRSMVGEDGKIIEGEKTEEEEGEQESKIAFDAGISLTLVPFQFVSRDMAEYEGNYWLGTGSDLSTSLCLSGHSKGKIGFSSELGFGYTPEGDAIEVDLSEAYIWLKPVDWFRLDVGKFFNGAQAGKIGRYWLSSWTVGMQGGGSIFSGQASDDVGLLAQFKIPPVKGLNFSVFVPSFGIPFTKGQEEFSWLQPSSITSGGDQLNSDDNSSNKQRALRVFERTWFTVSYVIKDDSEDGVKKAINNDMHIRAQYVGANSNGSVNWTNDAGDVQPYRYRVSVTAPRVEAAFAYTLKKLFNDEYRDLFSVDLGFKTWLPVSSWATDVYSQDIDNPGYLMSGDGSFWGGIGFGLGVKINVTKELIINFRVDGDLLRSWNGSRDGDISITNPMRLSCHLWPAYTLPNDMVIMAAFGANYVGRNEVDLNGTNPNEDNTDWERSDRLRLGGGVSLRIPLFDNGAVNVGIAYNNGTDDTRGGESRTITFPVGFSLSY